jgi:YggT family protein
MIPAFLEFYTMVVLAAVILSWLRLPPQNPVVQVLDALTEPFLKPIRKLIPASGGMDFSPIILLLGVQLLRGLMI